MELKDYQKKVTGSTIHSLARHNSSRHMKARLREIVLRASLLQSGEMDY